MENASYALQIAIGTLIAIVIISLTVFFWQKFGIMEKSKDDAQEIKNRSEFNAEWQAYEKNLMYGSDVLSCLNKAQNNNQKYVYNNYYGQDPETIGTEGRNEYFIDVEVTLKSDLCDSVKAYYRDANGKYKRITGLTDAQSSSSFFSNKVFADDNTKKTFDDPMIYYYYFKQGKVYQEADRYTNIMWGPGKANTLTLGNVLKNGGLGANSGQVKTMITGVPAGTTYHLLQHEDDNKYSSNASGMAQAAKLSALISTVNLKEQKLVNPVQPSDFTNNNWWYCTWTTATNDFKSRKFKCTGLELDRNTGYANKISFEEL